jgi:hypothetical protein
MSKDCEKYKAIILASDSHLDRETCNHIAECPECEALASAWMSLRNIRLPNDSRTTPELDFAIISRSDTFSRRQNVHGPSSIVTKIIYFTAAAACMLLVSWLVLSYNYRLTKEETDHANISWRSSSMEKDMFYMETNLEVVRRDLVSGEWRREFRLINKQTEKLFGLK